ncbi:glyoxylase-like metal-dependent hydrolase (beta-lactamase superfamily II) [Peribacillus deserti]|uniref:Glyoxylase-like metal-dependent hydrolase (Beta-lactamase superfamily II) n=1 Tax=Peribacillus deserti TaxID=673318 RepID=A0ABS2QLD8_9BACI|nr:glyoxylase-like metal-dependent hydrolase (beta-lactamase superfamily II) [Peribacillus deserti]
MDTGNPGPSSINELKSQLDLHKLSFKDFDSIVLTHLHTDHSGGVSEILKEVDLPVYVHENAEWTITGGINEFKRTNEFFYSFMEECGADPREHMAIRTYREENWGNVSYIRDKDTLPMAGISFEVLYVPGHSQTDIVLWDPKTGITFGGDLLIADFSVNPFVEPPPPGMENRPKSLLQYRHSLERVKNLPLGTIYPGHGEPFMNHIELIERRLAEQENRCFNIQECLLSGEKNVYELCGMVYPRLHGRMIFLGLSQIQGHLDLMETRNMVEGYNKGPVRYYKLVL